MPFLRSLTKLTPSDVLSHVITGLEILNATSSVVTSVPLVGCVVSAALGIARTVEKVQSDRERHTRLARRAADLARHVEDSMESDLDAIDDALKANLGHIHALLNTIRDDVEKELRRKPLSRFLHQASIASNLEDHLDALDSAWRAFDTACLIALRMKMERQALYDDRSQLRLFRWCDLRCHKVRGKYRIGGEEVGEEWEGKWEGRAVVVRTLRKPQAQQATVTYYPNIYHPYIAQVIGRSHPIVPERFYVIETGVMPLIQQFRGKDILSRLLVWLQHIIDYQDAYHYMEDKGFPASECHSHDRCLPSAMLNEEGRLIIDASDFCDSNLGCFQSCLRTMYDEVHGALSPGKDYADDQEVAPYASQLLSVLRSGMGTHARAIDIEPFINSDLGKIWASHPFQNDVNAQWGDYGYIRRDGPSETFVRLGHIYDLVVPTGKISTFLLRRYSGEDWKPAEDYPWPTKEVCRGFQRYTDDTAQDHIEEVAVVRTLPDDCEYHDFFWNHAESIAERHGIAVHDVVIFEEIFHYAGAVFDDNDSSTEYEESSPSLIDVPQEVFFHQLPPLASGEAPSPWGYWSLEPNSTPGPWPELQIPGVELICRVTSNYARVSTFEAEMLQYLNRLRRHLPRAVSHALESPAACIEEIP